MHLIEMLGLGVIGLERVVADWPGRRDAVEMAQFAEILLAQTIERRAEHLGGAADKIVNLGLKRLSVRCQPGLRRDVAVDAEDVLDAPVAGFPRQPVAALEDQDPFPGRREPVGQSAPASAAADDDQVIALGHRDQSPTLLCIMPPSAKIVVAVR